MSDHVGRRKPIAVILSALMVVVIFGCCVFGMLGARLHRRQSLLEGQQSSRLGRASVT
jgi:hypothetical protein